MKTQPKQWERYVKYYGDDTQEKLYRRLEDSITEHGLVYVLKNGIKDMGIDSLKVVYSIEPPIKTGVSTPQSISYAPAIAGITLASEVILDIARVDR